MDALFDASGDSDAAEGEHDAAFRVEGTVCIGVENSASSIVARASASIFI